MSGTSGLFSIVKWVSVTTLGAMSLLGFKVEKGNVKLDEEILKGIKLGSVVKLSDLIHDKADIICILHPYQDKVSEKHPESVVMNRYLQDIKYRASESYWSLVTSTSFSTTHYTFKRSKVLDIFAAHSQISSAAVALPATFEMAECASFEQAALFKTAISGRVYMMFGSVK